MRLRLIPSLLAALCATPAMAQNPWEPSTTIEQAIARTVATTMPLLEYDWTLQWSPFGTRASSPDLFWHLHPPKPYHPFPPAEGVHHRSGWMNVNWRSASVSVCGDADIVSQMSIEVTDTWLGESDVIEELAARGVTATQTAEQLRRPLLTIHGDPDEAAAYYSDEVTRYPALRTWRLEKAGSELVDLSASYTCTPPGTRSATQCKMTWTITFRPDERASLIEPCLPPRRESYD